MIPTDLIRRYPFANAIPHISDTMQAIIARDMADHARREDHHKALPPTQMDKTNMADAAHKRLRELILLALEQGPMTSRGVRDVVKRDAKRVYAVLEELADEGLVEKAVRRTHGVRPLEAYILAGGAK